MTVRREIAEPRCETGARRAEDSRRARAQYIEGPKGDPAGQRLVAAADRR